MFGYLLYVSGDRQKPERAYILTAITKTSHVLWQAVFVNSYTQCYWLYTVCVNKNVNQGLQMCEISKLNSPLKETKSMFLSSQPFLTWNDTFMYERPVRES